jgi:hypothetical protein
MSIKFWNMAVSLVVVVVGENSLISVLAANPSFYNGLQHLENEREMFLLLNKGHAGSIRKRRHCEKNGRPVILFLLPAHFVAPGSKASAFLTCLAEDRHGAACPHGSSSFGVLARFRLGAISGLAMPPPSTGSIMGSMSALP